MIQLNNLKKVKEKINTAAKGVNKNPDQIQLVAVSKTMPPETIKAVYDEGQLIFGENYVQEFLKKQELFPQIKWHFIGQLQSNKVKYIVNKISMLHSLDRLSLLSEIGKRYQAANSSLDALIQVNIGSEIQKGGVNPEDLFKFMDSAMNTEGVNLSGLMCIHPFEEPEECRKYFVKMFELFQKAKDRGYPMKHLSMGMSSDYTQAIEEGSTMVRVGSAIFGSRN